MSTHFLDVIELTKCWGEKTVSLSFSMEEGESLALLGASGCGKSTILKMLAGLIRPTSGRFFLNGKDMLSVKAYQRGIGMVFQDYALFPHLSVQDNIAYGLISKGIKKKEARITANEWIERFSLQGLEKKQPETLSGGEKQRVALARTLAVNPSVVLFDEALSALDADLRGALQEELKAHQQKFGYTAIYVTHDTNEANNLATRIIRME